MKTHKYWGFGALFCMIGAFYTGYDKRARGAHKYFAFMSMVCMVMSIVSGYKIFGKKSKPKKSEEINFQENTYTEL